MNKEQEEVLKKIRESRKEFRFRDDPKLTLLEDGSVRVEFSDDKINNMKPCNEIANRECVLTITVGDAARLGAYLTSCGDDKGLVSVLNKLKAVLADDAKALKAEGRWPELLQ